ncbi:hypothetical protein K661_01000 [Piscirickettsia salmonis LF-89 = ATCC VR-1361]|nr:hypothetical protein K661_01000 [Piscirickettsia salmonis LF-89 = ATCC VR-1361]
MKSAGFAITPITTTADYRQFLLRFKPAKATITNDQKHKSTLCLATQWIDRDFL